MHLAVEDGERQGVVLEVVVDVEICFKYFGNHELVLQVQPAVGGVGKGVFVRVYSTIHNANSMDGPPSTGDPRLCSYSLGGLIVFHRLLGTVWSIVTPCGFAYCGVDCRGWSISSLVDYRGKSAFTE